VLIACVWMNFWRHPTSKCKADGPWFGSLRCHQKLKNLSGEFAGIVFLRALDCEIKEWTARLFVLCAKRIRKTISISNFICSWNWLQISDSVKTKIVARFWEARRDFLGRMDGFCWRKIVARFSTGVTRFLDKAVVPCVVRLNRDAIVHWRGAIVSVTMYYISVSLQILKESLKWEKLGLQRR